jgi:hypothetical protein
MPHTPSWAFENGNKASREADSRVSWHTTELLPVGRAVDIVTPLEVILVSKTTVRHANAKSPWFSRIFINHYSLQLSIPTPAIFPTSTVIPWTLSIPSSLPLLRLIPANLDIHVVKRVQVGVGVKCSREYLVGRGELWKIVDDNDGTIVMRGVVNGWKQGAERSWD